ncbi:MAG: hypothetical protein Q4C36_01685 [Coriobacteriia bacterium]|nr:hypothetical protein [Coriobacteriia bacterium]
MSLNDMTPEQMEKAQACKASEELAEFAQSIGVALSEEELAAVAGGIQVFGIPKPCPKDTPCTMYVDINGPREI